MSKVTEHNIAQYKQNRIKLVVKDLSHYAPEEAIRKVLLKRGINKWLYCRKRFIGLKNELKDEVTFILAEMQIIKAERRDLSKQLKADTASKDQKILKKELYKLCKKYDKLVGRLNATSTIKENIRSVCHLSRWQFPE